MKRFMVFMGYKYYPSGGWLDFQTSCDSVDNALGFVGAQGSKFDWWQIVDRDTGKIAHSAP